MATERTYSNLLMWKDDRLLEDVNGKCVEELMGSILVLLVEANVFRLLGCCAMDDPIEAQTSPLPHSSPAIPQCLISLSCCDAYEYARCPCTLRSLFLVERQLVVRIQEVRGCLDLLHFFCDASSQY